MTRWVTGMIAGLLVACGGGDGAEVPSCQQALEHYYGAGCLFVDLQTGEPIPLGQEVSVCRELLSTAPSSCEDDLNGFLLCLDGVPAAATSNADCDCSQEQEALLTCG